MSVSLFDFKKLNLMKKKKNKYNAKKVVIDGITFDSTSEGEYYKKLKLAKKTGKLINFYMQVPFSLPGNVKYKLDFLEIWEGGLIKHTDVKGVVTAIFSLKKKQVEEIYGIEIILV